MDFVKKMWKVWMVILLLIFAPFLVAIAGAAWPLILLVFLPIALLITIGMLLGR